MTKFKTGDTVRVKLDISEKRKYDREYAGKRGVITTGNWHPNYRYMVDFFDSGLSNRAFNAQSLELA